MVLVRQCLQFAHKDEGRHGCRDKYDANEKMEAHQRKAKTELQLCRSQNTWRRTNSDKRITAELYVTREKCVPILGLEVSVALGLVQPGDNLVTSQGDRVQQIDAVEATEPAITMDTLDNEYKDIFSGLGCYPGKYNIELNPGAQPVIDPPRRVPQALYEPFREKLKKLEARGVIIAVDEPTNDRHNGEAGRVSSSVFRSKAHE